MKRLTMIVFLFLATAVSGFSQNVTFAYFLSTPVCDPASCMQTAYASFGTPAAVAQGISGPANKVTVINGSGLTAYNPIYSFANISAPDGCNALDQLTSDAGWQGNLLFPASQSGDADLYVNAECFGFSCDFEFGSYVSVIYGTLPGYSYGDPSC